MIKTKNKTIRFNNLTSAMAWILYRLELFHYNEFVSQPQDLVITSINDGQHVEGSRHYTDEAIDLRTHNFTSFAQKVEFGLALQDYLGKKFRVFIEGKDTPNEHFHIQVRKGMKYP